MTDEEPVEARCPFCAELLGLVTQLADLDEDGHAIFAVVCRSCGAQGPHAETPEEALTEWAHRAEDDEDDEDDEQLDPELAAALERAITKRVHALLRRRG